MSSGGAALAPLPTPVATPQHVAHCFEVLHGSFSSGGGGKDDDDDDVSSSSSISSSCVGTAGGGGVGARGGAAAFGFPTSVVAPFFVSLHVVDRHGQHTLRGCIGTLTARPLAELGEYARRSAFSDRRFDPLAEGELRSLRITVSLLNGHEACEHPLDWVVGTHGIIIFFDPGDGGGERTATYLPDVAREQGWSQREAVASLVRKAGWPHALPPSRMAAMRVTRYVSSKASMSYAEWWAGR